MSGSQFCSHTICKVEGKFEFITEISNLIESPTNLNIYKLKLINIKITCHFRIFIVILK